MVNIDLRPPFDRTLPVSFFPRNLVIEIDPEHVFVKSERRVRPPARGGKCPSAKSPRANSCETYTGFCAGAHQSPGDVARAHGRRASGSAQANCRSNNAESRVGGSQR